MESVYLLVPLSIMLLGAAVWAFFWAVNRGQFEDLDAPSRIALEDDAPAGGAPPPQATQPGATVPRRGDGVEPRD